MFCQKKKEKAGSGQDVSMKYMGSVGQEMHPPGYQRFFAASGLRRSLSYIKLYFFWVTQKWSFSFRGSAKGGGWVCLCFIANLEGKPLRKHIWPMT